MISVKYFFFTHASVPQNVGCVVKQKRGISFRCPFSESDLTTAVKLKKSAFSGLFIKLSGSLAPEVDEQALDLLRFPVFT